MLENNDDVPTTTYVALTAHSPQSRSQRTKSLKGYNQTNLQIDGSLDGHDEEGTLDSSEEATLDGNMANMRINGSDVSKESGVFHQMPTWLSKSTPDEFLEIIRKSDAPLHVKYLQTMVKCLCMLRKMSAVGVVICQRLRPTIHETITSMIRSHVDLLNSSRSSIGQGSRTGTGDLNFIKGQLESYQLPKQNVRMKLYCIGTCIGCYPIHKQ